VGITRAKHGLVIVGNAAVLRKEANWNRLLQKKAVNVVKGIKGAKKWIFRELTKARVQASPKPI